MTAEAPVIIQTEFQPPLTSSFSVGVTTRHFASIVDSTTHALIDPDTLTLTVTPPNTAATVYTYGVGGQVAKSSTGVYYSDMVLNAGGKWRMQWLATLGATLVGSNTSEIYANPVTGW